MEATCSQLLKNGQFCKHKVPNGAKFCWQHARGIKQRWKSLTRNQSIAFILVVAAFLIGLEQLAKDIWPSLVPFSLTAINAPHIDTDIELAAPLSAGAIPQANAVFKNNGQTTARRFRIASGFIIGKHSDDTAFERFLILQRDPNELQTIADLGPTAKGTATNRYRVALSGTEVADIQNGQQQIYITGVFAYEDLKGQRHDGKFCSTFVPRPALMQLCNSHNEQN